MQKEHDEIVYTSRTFDISQKLIESLGGDLLEAKNPEGLIMLLRAFATAQAALLAISNIEKVLPPVQKVLNQLQKHIVEMLEYKGWK